MSNDPLMFLTTGPVLATLAGCRARLRLLAWDELLLLCRHFNCDAGGLDRRLWTGRRRKKATGGPVMTTKTEKRQLRLIE